MKKIISLFMIIVLFVTVVPSFAADTSSAVVDDMKVVSAGTGTLETNSFLTKEQYADLGLILGSAQSCDAKGELNPLLGMAKSKEESGVRIAYNGNVTYGWSNPQILSVMLSSPYWDELNYGSDMSAAGSSTIRVSSSIGSGEGSQSSVDLGISLAVDGEISAAGNGVVFGGKIELSGAKITETVKEKASEVSVELECGANTDNVVLYVVPMAFYEYEVYSDGQSKPDHAYVQVPLGTVFTVISLDKYNEVAQEVNYNNGSENIKMTVIDMDNIYPNYTAGDPSTYFTSENDFPTSYTIEYGQMIPQDDNAIIHGSIYRSNTEYSISPANSDTGGVISYSGSSSNTTTYSQSYSLNGELTAGIKVGVDVFDVTSTSTTKVSGSIGYESLHSNSTVNTKTISSTVEYIDLPTTATSAYSFKASQVVWTPTQVSESVIGCPACIIASTVVIDGDYPLYLPDDLHISAVTNNSITLSWSNPNFNTSPYKYRQPDSYNICMQSSGNIKTYTVLKTISADNESVTIHSLIPGEEYTFALQSVKGAHSSVIGPSVSMITSYTGLPVITTQPTDMIVQEGEKVVFTVEALPLNEGDTLEYQWQKLVESKYGSNWSDVLDEKNNTLSIEVNAGNANVLDSSVYRCVVTEKMLGGSVNTVSNSAKLSVVYKIEDYDDLVEVAQLINNGDKKYSHSNYVVLNDIKIPEGTQWTTPIGTTSTPFEGTFDGMGNTISGMNIYDATSKREYYGLFGVVKYGTIKNINLENVDITIAYAETGAICGYIEEGAIVDCTASGKIINAVTDATGGICAEAYSSLVHRCINYCEIISSSQAGGVGGVCGLSNDNATFKKCANIGEVLNEYSNNLTAGISGGPYSDIVLVDCFNYGKVRSASGARVNSYPLCRNLDGVTVVNSYYLDTSVEAENADMYDGVMKTAEEFSSGEVAFLLNNGEYSGAQAWYQNIDNIKYDADAYPTLTNNGWNTVYKVDREDKVYSNQYFDYLLGDVDDDGRVTIVDATLIQRHLAEISTITGVQLLAADTDKDNVISISDATRIQIYLTQYITEL
ncbi:MAG: hypothetical protein E7513_02415 [Ruminococcaceae bacterium]|nr:hypothetical protein [Oscillospiraceae bacterium]